VPRRELRIISTVRIIIDTMPTTIIGIFLVNTIDTMRASMFMVTTPSAIVGKVLRGTRARFRRVLCSSRLMKDRLPLGMRTWAAGRGLGVAGTCVNRSVAIRDLNTISRDHGLITAPTLAVHLSALVVWRHHVGKIVARENGQWIVQSGNDGHAVRTRPRSLAGAIAFRGAYASM